MFFIETNHHFVIGVKRSPEYLDRTQTFFSPLQLTYGHKGVWIGVSFIFFQYLKNIYNSPTWIQSPLREDQNCLHFAFYWCLLIVTFSNFWKFCVKNVAIIVMIIWQLDLQLPVQSVPITTKVVSSNAVHGKTYSIWYVIKFVSDFRQVGGFLMVLRFPPPTKLTATIQLKYC